MIACCLSPTASAAYFNDTINDVPLYLPEGPQNYSFLFVGHPYGSPGSLSSYPASSFLTNIDMFNEDNASFMILLGDNYIRTDPHLIENFQASIATDVTKPLVNVIGNHDQIDESYDDYFGIPRYYEFTYGSDKFIALNSGNFTWGEITGDQYDFLMNSINETMFSPEIDNVFIMMHKTLWSKNNDDFSILDEYKNTDVAYDENFKDTIMPAIISLSEVKNVYMLAGDTGIQKFEWYSLPIFYHEDREHENITYISAAMGDIRSDAVIKAFVKGDGDVEFKATSLTNMDIEEDVTTYDVEYWENHYSTVQHVKYNKFKAIISSGGFKYGVFVSFGFMFGILLVVYLFKRGKSVN